MQRFIFPRPSSRGTHIESTQERRLRSTPGVPRGEIVQVLARRLGHMVAPKLDVVDGALAF